MAMPAHLLPHQETAKIRAAAVRSAAHDVHAALVAAVLADVRSVHSTIKDGRVQVTVQVARWHDVNLVLCELVDRVPGLVDPGITGSIIRVYREIGD